MHKSSEVMPAVQWRAMRRVDLDDVVRIQREACGGHGGDSLEPGAVLRERLRVAPDTAWVAVLEGRAQAGYRFRLGCVTPLHGVFEVQARGTCLYLHDLAASCAVAGRGIGQALVDHALRAGRARGCAHSALVSVQGSSGFWRRRGYAGQPLAQPAMRDALATYGAGAVYMARAGRSRVKSGA